MSVRICLQPVTFGGAYFVHVCVHTIIEGGFHPGPIVKVSGGDTTAAHVRLIPPPFRVRASCAPRFQDHHDNHIYAILFPQTKYMDTSTPFQMNSNLTSQKLNFRLRQG